MVDDGSTDGTHSCLPTSPDESPSTTWTDVASQRHGIEASRSRRASCSCSSTPTISFRRVSGAIRRGCSRYSPRGGLPLRLAWNRLRRRARSLRAGPALRPRLDPFHALAAAGSPHLASLAVRRTTAARVGPFDETESAQADWDYWLRLAASGAPFPGVPGNVAIIRPQRQHVGLGRNAARRRWPGRSRAESLAPPALPCLHPFGRRSPELATGFAARRRGTSRAGSASRAAGGG